jgi:hypothetical protein
MGWADDPDRDRNRSRLRPQSPQNAQNSTPIATGPLGSAFAPGARDRFNRSLQVGDQILYKPNVDLVFQIMAISPLLDARASGPVFQMVLACEVPLQVPPGHPIINMVWVKSPDPKTQDEPKPKPKPKLDLEPDPEELEGRGPSDA